MSENIPFGTPLEGPTDLGDPDGPKAEPGGRRRTMLIAAGSAVALAVAGVAAVLLTGGGSDDPTPFTMPTPRHSSATTSPTPTSSLSLLPTEAAVNARNPFLHPPSPKASGSGTDGSGAGGGGGAVSTVTATKTVVSTGANKTVKSTSTVKSTVTAPSTGVYLALFSVAGTAGNQAVFQVASGSGAGVRYQVTTAHDFGPDNVFRYTGTTTLNSVLCADVTYVDEAFTICPGDMNKVH